MSGVEACDLVGTLVIDKGTRASKVFRSETKHVGGRFRQSSEVPADNPERCSITDSSSTKTLNVVVRSMSRRRRQSVGSAADASSVEDKSSCVELAHPLSQPASPLLPSLHPATAPRYSLRRVKRCSRYQMRYHRNSQS